MGIIGWIIVLVIMVVGYWYFFMQPSKEKTNIEDNVSSIANNVLFDVNNSLNNTQTQPSQTSAPVNNEVKLTSVIETPADDDSFEKSAVVEEPVLATSTIIVNETEDEENIAVPPCVKDVRLTRQISNTKCVKNQNFGLNTNGLTMFVNSGCRGGFEVDLCGDLHNISCASWNYQPSNCGW